MGETCAVCQSVGTTPVSKDILKRMYWQVLLTFLVLVHLGPAAFDGSRLDSNFAIP